ncbi:MAG: hypothetical protein E7183_02285 [Erysipelotrichaceae bacterium]|nr:hypothetical protein [Erysipelotrichaceae bacterium]
MKKLIKLFVCLILVVCAGFAVANSKVNQNVSIDAASNLVEVTDDNGNIVYHRNSSEPVMRLKEYNYPTQNLRACWVSNFVGSLPKYSSEENWKADYTYVLDKMEEYGLNCIIFHVRTHNNALYKSELNPVASWFANVNFDEFDPLAWAIEETHKRGIEFHAWLNPYRISTNGGKTQYVSGSIPANNPVNDSSKLLQSGDSIILNPGIQSNRDFIVDSCMEVVENYDVDAIHFDDYFYISGVETDKSGDWKRQQVDLFIEQLSNELRDFNEKHNKAIQLGISPSGIYQNGGYSTTPKYDSNGNLTSPLYSNTSGFAHYGNYLYSDTLKWINEEWIDYIMPQTYWSLEQTAAQFGSLSRWWSWAVANKDVNLYLGMGIYMPGDNSNWRKNKYEVRDQILNAEMYDEVGGFSFYSYNYLDSTNVYTKTGMDIVKDDYFSVKIPGDVKKYYANIYDTIDVENVQVKDGVLMFDECENVRGYVVYKVKRGNVLDQENINHMYYYGTDTNIKLDDTINYVYYVSSVNLANEISTPVCTENIDLKAEDVVERINKLPEVIKFEHENLVKEIEAVYNVLPQTERTKVTNIKVLNDALALLEEKHNAVEVTVKYKDLDNYTTDTKVLMQALIDKTQDDINLQPNLTDLNDLMTNFKNEMDKFKVLSEELAEIIVTAKETLNNHFATFDLSYYESQDQKDMQGYLEDALEAIDKAKSASEINEIVATTIENMDSTPHFKEEYDAAIKEIEDALQKLVNEALSINEWYKYHDLTAKTEEIITNTKAITKFSIYKNSTKYLNQATADFNEYIALLDELYSLIQQPIQSLKDYYNSLELDYYEENEKDTLDSILANAIDSLNKISSQDEIESIVNDAKSAMNEVPTFKEAYDEIINEINDAIDLAINELILNDEWLANRNYEDAKENIINNIKNENKVLVYQNSTTYINNAKNACNEYVNELKELYKVIQEPIQSLKDYCTNLGLDYYEDVDKQTLNTILENAIAELNQVDAKSEIDEIITNAKLAMNEVPSFKAAYNAKIKEIDDTIQTLINENIADNEWFAKRNLTAKKDEIINAIKNESKINVYKDTNTYLNNAKKEFNEYVQDLRVLYIKIKNVVSTINSYDDSKKGASELISEYIEKIELAENKEMVVTLENEFKTKYEELSNKSKCSFGVISFINLFAALSLALIIFRKK